MDTLGDEIRAQRKRAGHTQASLGAAVGTSEAQIGHYESGRESPSMERAAAIARALGLPAWHFFQFVLDKMMGETLRVPEATGAIIAPESTAAAMPAEDWIAIRARGLATKD